MIKTKMIKRNLILDIIDVLHEDGLSGLAM
jgi:nucleoside diphosphate kinase